jgi:chemotaxis protein methyltransferase CheR
MGDIWMDLDYEKFKQNIRLRTGIDLSLYKEAQMKRRLGALKDKKGYTHFSEFFQSMMENKVLLEEFLDRMTINVTECFRNPERWKIVEQKVIPLLLEDSKTVKVWSAACSTGEEAYTIAMILSEALSPGRFSITATDLDELALKRARLGYYLERSLQEVPEDLKQKYFIKEGIGFKVDEPLQERIQFKQHNLLSNSYESNCDLIVCRNVLIYFTEAAKEEIYHKFSSSLRKGGILFVGSTEQIFNPAAYGLVSIDTFFYQKS